MHNGSEPLFQPLSKVAVSGISGPVVRLQSRREMIEIRVLTPDLFRIRIVRGKSFSQQPSWAVAKTEWDPAATKIHPGARTVTLATSAGELVLRLADGSWKLVDASGNEAFATVPSATGFAGEQGRTTLMLAE